MVTYPDLDEAPFDLKDAETIRREIESSKAALRGLLPLVDQIRAAYRGGAFDKAGTKFLENRVFEYVSVMAPKTVANDPRVIYETALGQPWAREVAGMVQGAMNQWVADTAHGRFLSRVAQDFYSSWCGVHVGLDVIPGGTDANDGRSRPVVSYIDPHDLFWDPLAQSWESRLWSAHRYVRRVTDLLERAKKDKSWKVSAIHEAALDVGLDEMGRLSAAQHSEQPRRSEIICYDVWYPMLDGKSMLYTICICGEGKTGARGVFLREPKEFDGPASGPHVLFASRTFLGSSMPLSPLMVAWEQLVELNHHAQAISRAARRRKKVGLVNYLAKQDGEALKNAQDGEVIAVQNSANGAGWFAEIETGGLTPAMMAAWTVLNQRADRLLGMDDAQSGIANDKATATAVATASMASQVRSSDLIGTFEECDRQLLDAVSYYMVMSDKVAIRLKIGEDERKRRGIPLDADVTYKGGDFKGDIRDFGLKLERYSMQRVTDAVAQRRAMDLISLILQVGPVAPQLAQYVDLEWTFDMIGDWMNIPQLGRIFGAQKAAEMYADTGPIAGQGREQMGGVTGLGQESGNAVRVS